MLRMYDIDGQKVTVARVPQRQPPAYTIRIEEVPVAGSVEKTALGRYLASDDRRRCLGTFVRLREAVEQVVRATHRSR